MNIKKLHTQEITDVLSAARLSILEPANKTYAEMFQSSVGGVILGDAKSFHERVAAYEAHKTQVPEILADLAYELHQRGV